MKKLLALLLVLAMVFSVMTVFTACEDSSSSSSKSDKDDDDDDDDKKKDDKDDEDEDEDEDNKDDEDEDNKDNEDEDNKDDEDEDKDEPSKTSDIVGEWEGEVDMACILNYMFEASLGDLAEYLTLDSFEVRFTFEFDDDGMFSMTINERDFEKELENAAEVWIDGYYEIIDIQIEEQGLDMTPDEYAEQHLGMSVEDFIEEALVSGMDAAQFENYGNYELDGSKLYMDSSREYYIIEIDGDELVFEGYSEGGLDEELLGGIVFERQ